MAKTLKTRGASVAAARKSARLASRSTATAGPVALPPSSLSRCSPPPAMRRVAQPLSPGPRSPSSPAAVPLLSLPSVSPPSPVHCQSSSLKSVPRPAFLLPLPTPKPILPSPVQAAVPSVLPLLISFFLVLVLLLFPRWVSLTKLTSSNRLSIKTSFCEISCAITWESYRV